MNSLSPRMSRFAAIALLVLLVFAIFLYAILPLWNYYTDKAAEIKLLHKQVQRFEYLLANETVVDEKLAQSEQENSEGDLFLAGNKPAIASAHLREYVANAVEKSGGQLISSQEYHAEPIAASTPIGLQLRVSGEVKNLIELVHSLESARPVIFIDELSVSSASSRIRSARSKSKKKQPAKKNSLDIRMSIVGYLAGSEVAGNDTDGS